MIQAVSGAQCRMARGLLRWSVDDLCAASGVSSMTIKRLEKVDGIPNSQTSTLEAIHSAFVKTGRIRFEGDNGVFAVLEENAVEQKS